MAQSAEQLGQQARHSDALDHAIRVGFLAYGLVHLVVAWLAVQLALGSSAGKVSSKSIKLPNARSTPRSSSRGAA